MDRKKIAAAAAALSLAAALALGGCSFNCSCRVGEPMVSHTDVGMSEVDDTQTSPTDVSPLTVEDMTIEHETKFGGVYIHKTIDEFCDLGFEYGDSVDVVFSNGGKFEDIPFYNGYYVRTGDPILVAYPGYPYIKIGLNNGADLFTEAGLDESCTATVTRREKGKYIATQNAMSMVYTNDRANYADDETFANFRAMTGGQLKENLFYRAASPCDDQYNRAAYSSALCEKAGVGYVIDLADSEEELEGYLASETDDPYWRSLCENGKVLPLDMAANYRAETYAQSVAKAMRAVLTEEGPFLIHCTEGKDRTGFVCVVVEMLAGAGCDELESDYMKTYDNYYGVTEKSDPEGYAAVRELKFDDFLMYLCETETPAELTAEELRAGAEKYLAFGGMTADEIERLEAKITGK